VREQLEKDLQNKVVNPKSGKGLNTYFFGDNRQGKCGLGNEEAYVVKPSYLFTKFREVVSGHHHNLALDKNKIVYSWGRNRYG
jgi:alpha-tubulin suppressor-like RCC1 family protein